MNIRKQMVSTMKYNIKCPYSMTPKYITIHNTANDAPALNEVKYMISNNNEVSFHYAVDDKEVVQGLPLERNAWHAGDGSTGTGNRQSIGIEICYSKSGGEQFDTAEKNAAKFVAQLLLERKWGIDKVKPHKHWSGKDCPHRTLDKGWQRFLDMVQAEMEPKTFLVEIICSELNIREEADFDSKVKGVVKKGEVFTIVEEKNGLGKLKSGAGWISMNTKYIKRK